MVCAAAALHCQFCLSAGDRAQVVEMADLLVARLLNLSIYFPF